MLKNDYKRLFIHYIVSLCLIVPLMFSSLALPYIIKTEGGFKWSALVQCVLSGIILGVNYKSFINGFAALFKKVPDTDALVAICSGVSFLYSLVLTVLLFFDIEIGESYLYFDVAGFTVAIAAIGKWPEGKAKSSVGDKVAGVFVPAVTAIALITFIVWLLIDGGFVPGHCITYAVSVFVVSCPCALALATPVAVMTATGKGDSLGILYKDAAALQKTCELNCILLSETAVVKESSAEAIASLKARGMRIAMLTGDGERAAEAVAARAGIDDYVAEVMPEDKLRAVENMQKIGGTVAMVGDGINDSPALKQADVGVAIGDGADVAVDSACIVLADGDLRSLDTAISLSRATVRNIKQNLFWAFFCNAVMLPVAAGAFSSVGFYFNPMIAALCMCLSSLFVVLNALRLLLFKNKNSRAVSEEKSGGGIAQNINNKKEE